STSLGTVEPSYKPGVNLTDLSTALPDYVIEAIREALPQIDRKLPGFAMHDAMLTGVETRTSSPIRVKRQDNYQSMNVAGLFPAGEGAGYAGGIYSAAIDGIKVAEALALDLAGAGAA
ncbi:MAG: FAD-dependent protein, partial [Janthinobacterium lividum]